MGQLMARLRVEIEGFRKQDLIAFASFAVVGCVMIVMFAIEMGNVEVRKDSQRYPISETMMILAVIGTVLSVL
jgi:hypothetical protein